VRVHTSLSDVPADWPGCVLSIGNFDGVHLGHQKILAALRDLSARTGKPPAVLTFDPHPAALLRPEAAPVWIMPLSRRLELLAGAGVAAAVVIGPDRAFFAQTAGEFIQSVLVKRLRVAGLAEGPDFRFGMDRRGDVETLRAAGRDDGFEMVVVEPVPAPPADLPDRAVSSTLIRTLVAGGRVAEAAECLGRPFEIEGVVTRGAGRGRTLGTPTANLDPEGRLTPAAGVYAASAELPDSPGPARPAAVFVGAPPTFPGERVRVEAHLLDFSGDLYGRRLRVGLLERLRGLIAFSGPEELSRQIAEDIRRTRGPTAR
jgi:riboflavin kinase/FMN adenylyltransferase